MKADRFRDALSTQGKQQQNGTRTTALYTQQSMHHSMQHAWGMGRVNAESSASFSKLSPVRGGHELLRVFWGVNCSHSL